MTTIKIRHTRDTLSETYRDALRIRFQVFVAEQGVPRARELESPVEEAAAVHFVAYDDSGAPVGTVRLLAAERETSHDKGAILLQRMAVLPDSRHRGYASALLAAASDFAAGKYSRILLHAQLPARGFYAKYGFSEQGEIFEEAGIQHITMSKKI